MVSVKLSYWFRDRLHGVSSSLTALCSYMALDPLTEGMVFLYQCRATILGIDAWCNLHSNRFYPLCLGLEERFAIHVAVTCVL